MIFFNGKRIEPTQFPDGTSSFRFYMEGLECDSIPAITWKYDNDGECMIVWYLVNHIRSIMGPDTHVQLMMPYIPNARMDRVKNGDEVFTLKWFADFINSLHFCHVAVFDPHSNKVLRAYASRVHLRHQAQGLAHGQD